MCRGYKRSGVFFFFFLICQFFFLHFLTDTSGYCTVRDASSDLVGNCEQLEPQLSPDQWWVLIHLFPRWFRAPLSRMCWSGIKVRIGGLVRGQAVRGSLRVQVCTHVCVLMTADGMILRELERDYCWLTGELSRLHSIKCVWQSWGRVCSLQSDDERRSWCVWEDPDSDSRFSANTYLSSSATWANLTLLPTHTHTRILGWMVFLPCILSRAIIMCQREN